MWLSVCGTYAAVRATQKSDSGKLLYVTWPLYSELGSLPASALRKVDLPHEGGPSSSVKRPCINAHTCASRAISALVLVASLRQSTTSSALLQNVSDEASAAYVKASLRAERSSELGQAHCGAHGLQASADIVEYGEWPFHRRLAEQLLQCEWHDQWRRCALRTVTNKPGFAYRQTTLHRLQSIAAIVRLQHLRTTCVRLVS